MSIKKNITRATEDYLETLIMLEDEGVKLEITEIAKRLDVSKPAATQMMNELNKEGFVDKQPYSEIHLTEEGRLIGKKVYHRHLILNDFLRILGVPEDIAEEDCCKMEHVLSTETFNKMEEFVEQHDCEAEVVEAIEE